MEVVGRAVQSRAMGGGLPLVGAPAGPERCAEYTDWAVDIHRQVEHAVTAMNERGVVYGDLHLLNVIVRPDDTISLLDFEVAALVEDATRPGLAQQGFAAPRSMSGVDVDRYALACLRLAMFLPMTN